MLDAFLRDGQKGYTLYFARQGGASRGGRGGAGGETWVKSTGNVSRHSNVQQFSISESGIEPKNMLSAKLDQQERQNALAAVDAAKEAFNRLKTQMQQLQEQQKAQHYEKANLNQRGKAANDVRLLHKKLSTDVMTLKGKVDTLTAQMGEDDQKEKRELYVRRRAHPCLAASADSRVSCPRS